VLHSMPFGHVAGMPDQPDRLQPGRAPARAQDLDSLTGPLLDEVIERQLPAASLHQLVASWAG
jgi:hypothetical protein